MNFISEKLGQIGTVYKLNYHTFIFITLFYSALVWGSSVKHQPQKVGKDHVLNDEDVVQIVKKV